MNPSALPGIGRHVDTAQRAAEVVAAMTRFGFGEFLLQTGLEKYRRRTDGDRAEGEGGRQPLPVRVRLLLEELGPTFIKVGQIMSTRPDVIPADWVEELRKLQSDVPPAPWEGDDGVRAVLEEELGEDFESAFETIETSALAAASMAQVHRGTLVTGETVVLKILRPGIRGRIAADLDVMRLFARFSRSHFANMGFDVEAVIEEFARELERETDLTIEALSTERMRRDFEDQEGVTFPKVYGELSTRSVLALEFIDGTLLAKLDTASLDDEQRERIVRHGAAMVFRQCLEIGFFHADPHPGNIFVLEDERLCFIDCGMTGLIDPATINQLARLVHSVVEGKLDPVVRTAVLLTSADPSIADDRAFRADVWHFVDRFHRGSLESIRMGELLNEFFAILRKYELRCPADIVFLIKALTTIEGVAGSIAPGFDLVTHVRPYVERLVRQRYGVTAIRERLEGAAVAYSDLIETLPADITDLLRTVRQNRLSLKIDHQGLNDVSRDFDRASHDISWALVISALIVSSAVLILADALDRERSALSILATGVFTLAVIIGLGRLVVSWWQTRRR
jgi:ubiquinone biosynthesis protein